MTRELLPSIIEYAELGDFIDAPLRTYSSGMRARLGFAIATSVDPDILLLDEVLATGDANFRAKSKARVIEIVGAAKAVVLVTHDMNWVTEYCNRAILIERGEMIMEGEPADVVELHQVHTEEARARTAEAAQKAGMDPRIVRGPLTSDGARRPGQRASAAAAARGANDRHHDTDDTREGKGAAPVDERADLPVHLPRDDDAREALPLEGHPPAEHAPGGALIEPHVAGEQVAHERLPDPRITGQRDRDAAHVGRDGVGPGDGDPAHGHVDVLGIDP